MGQFPPHTPSIYYAYYLHISALQEYLLEVDITLLGKTNPLPHMSMSEGGEMQDIPLQCWSFHCAPLAPSPGSCQPRGLCFPAPETPVGSHSPPPH